MSHLLLVVFLTTTVVSNHPTFQKQSNTQQTFILNNLTLTCLTNVTNYYEMEYPCLNINNKHNKNSAIVRKFNIDFYPSALYQKWQKGCRWTFICNKIYLARKINLFKENIIYNYETFSYNLVLDQMISNEGSAATVQEASFPRRGWSKSLFYGALKILTNPFIISKETFYHTLGLYVQYFERHDAHVILS